MSTWEERPGDVLSVVVAAIDDETDASSFATADLMRVVRRDLDPPPTRDEVDDVLNLLALPIVGALRGAGDEWQIADALDVVARRLHYLADAIADYRHGLGGSLTLDDHPY